MAAKTLREWQNEVGAWGDVTFPDSNPGTVLAHLQEEAKELRAAFMTKRYGSVEDQEEAADVFLLLLRFAHKSGFDLANAATIKMAINRNRTWKTTPEPAGHFKHVED